MTKVLKLIFLVRLMEKDSFEFDFSKLGKIFNKSKEIKIFSILSLFFFLISLIIKFQLGQSILGGFGLFRFFLLFPWEIWFSLGIALVLSTVAAYYEKYSLIFLPIIIWLIFITSFVRTQNISDLKDISTGNWTLGPDLDPFLYLRHAIEISNGNLQDPDLMRSAPLGSKNYASANLMPWAIYYLYKVIGTILETPITFVAIIAPVLFTAFATLFFFLFIKNLFSFKFSRVKSTLVAIIATVFYIFNSAMLHRTTAGIPEIESLGMVWFWLAFLFFILAWKNKVKWKMILYGILSGISTGLMFWTWGGYKYIYMTFVLSSLLAFLFQKERERNFTIFFSWSIPALIIASFKEGSLFQLLWTLNDTGFAIMVLFIMIVDIVINRKEVKDFLKIGREKVSRSLYSVIVAGILGLFFVSVFEPRFVLNLISYVFDSLIRPFGGGRIGLTVAENKAPYFKEVFQTFGYFFWSFFFGVILLFGEMVRGFNKKLKIKLNLLFIIFISTFIFSRISPESLLNGENFISGLMYFGGLILFGAYGVYTYIKVHKEKDEKTISYFRNINISYLILLSFSILAIISMRGAVRLFFIIAPLIIIFSSYLIVKLFEYASKTKDSTSRLFFWIIFAITLILVLGTFVSQATMTTQEARATIPSAYYQQWQKAMSWVRDNTPESSIFVHWWDYGYWVQTIGERPTLTDGGHPSFAFTYESARYILTTSKPETALSMMKSLNISYLLIDSTDLGKYPAYSQIGSDENWDRFSSIPVMTVDKNQVQENQNETLAFYRGIAGVDQDIIYSSDEGEIFLPGPTFNEEGNPEYKSFIIGNLIGSSISGGSITFSRPKSVFFYNGNQYSIPVRYIYYNHELLDFGVGLDAVIMIIPALVPNNQGGSQVENLGASIYLSPRTKDTLFAQLYLMDDPLERYPTIKLEHVQGDIVVEDLSSQGIYQGDFIYYQGFRGPIKIWNTQEIPDEILFREEFLEREKYGGIGHGEIPFAPFDDFQFSR